MQQFWGKLTKWNLKNFRRCAHILNTHSKTYVKKINLYGTSHTTNLPVKLHTENPILNYTHGISSHSRMSLSSCLLTFCKYLSIYSECYTSIHIVKFHNVFLTVQRQCYTFWLRLHFCFNEGSMFCTWNVLPFEVHKKDFASPTHCITHCHNALEIGKEKKIKKRERHKPQVSSVFSAQPYSHDSPAVKTSDELQLSLKEQPQTQQMFWTSFSRKPLSRHSS